VREEIPSTNDLKTRNLCNSLFGGVNRVGKLRETGPVQVGASSGLRLLDVGIDCVANVTCSVYEYIGHLRVASEGHDIATHDLEQEFDDLCGRIAISGRLREHGEKRRRRDDSGAASDRGAARAASNANSLRDRPHPRSGPRIGG
jgi:hypothetical protein